MGWILHPLAYWLGNPTYPDTLEALGKPCTLVHSRYGHPLSCPLSLNVDIKLTYGLAGATLLLLLLTARFLELTLVPAAFQMNAPLCSVLVPRVETSSHLEREVVAFTQPTAPWSEVTPTSPQEVTPSSPKDVTPSSHKEVIPSSPQEVTLLSPQEVKLPRHPGVTPFFPQEVSLSSPQPTRTWR